MLVCLPTYADGELLHMAGVVYYVGHEIVFRLGGGGSMIGVRGCTKECHGVTAHGVTALPVPSR